MAERSSVLNNDIVSGLAIALTGLFAIITAVGFSKDLPIKESLGPHVIPIAVGVLLIICGAIIAWQGRKKPAGFAPKDGAHWYRSVRLLSFMGLMVAYIAVMDYVGYIAATVAFMTVAQILMFITWWKALLNAAVLTATVYAIFGILVNVPLPQFPLF